MSFNKTPLHVQPFIISLMPGDIEIIPIDPQFALAAASTPVASLVDDETGVVADIQPTVEDGDAVTPDLVFTDARNAQIVTVTGPPAGLYSLRVQFLGATGRRWSIKLGVHSQAW